MALIINIITNVLLILFLERKIEYNNVVITFSPSIIEIIIQVLVVFYILLLVFKLVLWLVLYGNLEMSKKWDEITKKIKHALSISQKNDCKTLELSILASKSFIDLTFKDKMKLLNFKARSQGYTTNTICLEYILIYVATLYKNSDFKLTLFFILISVLTLIHKGLYILYCLPLFTIIVR